MFGIELESNDGKRLLMSEAAHHDFVGKAGSATGMIYLTDFDTTYQVSGGTLTLTYDDEVRWFDLQIAADTPPLCFIHTQSQDTDHAAGITHIYEIKTGLYGIGIQQTYPVGAPLSGTGVDVYCFTRPSGFSTADGFELRDRNNKTTFHSDIDLLSIKGFATVPHWNDYSGMLYNHSISGLTKAAMPCFSNIAATYITTTKNTSGGGCTTRYVMSCDLWTGVCTGSTVYSCNYNWSSVKLRQMFRHTLTVNNTGIHQHLIGYPADVNDLGADGVVYPDFDATILPVIDGADYD